MVLTVLYILNIFWSPVITNNRHWGALFSCRKLTCVHPFSQGENMCFCSHLSRFMRDCKFAAVAASSFELVFFLLTIRCPVLCGEELLGQEGWRGVCAHWLCGRGAEEVWQRLVAHQVSRSSLSALRTIDNREIRNTLWGVQQCPASVFTRKHWTNIWLLEVDLIKGALCSFGEEIQTQNCNIYNINEVIIQIFSFLNTE